MNLSSLSGKSILITGATGLIGSSMLRALLRVPDAELTALGSDGLRDEYAWLGLPKFDYIIHAAGYAQPARFLADPLSTAFLGTGALLILLKKLKPNGRLLFLSTSEVYSGSPQSFHREDDIGTTKPSHPRAIYVESKRCGEAICHAARAENKTAIIARVSLAYGPGVKKGDKRVISEFIDGALKSNIIELKDGGSARRTYCYVSDISEMLFNILLKGSYAVYNVGGNSETTIVGLARKIGQLMNVQVKVPRNHGQAAEGAPAHVGLDISRYCNEFGPKNFVQWDEGLKQTIAWHKQLAGVMGT